MSRIQLNDFKASWDHYRDRVLPAIERVGESGWLILGEEVERFESTLADAWGLPFCVSCGSGLDALELGLRAAGLEAGQKVLTTPLSAFATSLSIVRAGGHPVFVDVDESGLLDLDLCEAALEADHDLRFLLPVHLYGHAVDLQRLGVLRDRFGLAIDEDCAQSIGARSGGAAVGTVGAFAATSFYPTKNLGCMGDGGAVLMQVEESADHIRRLRDYGQSRKFVHDHLGLNSRLDEIQAAILLDAYLPDLARTTTRRCEIAECYRMQITNPRLSPLAIPAGSDSVWHLYPMRVLGTPDATVRLRDSFREHLDREGIDTGVHYPTVIPDQAALHGHATDLALSPLTTARELARSEVSLPIHPFLSAADVERVVAACNGWCQ